MNGAAIVRNSEPGDIRLNKLLKRLQEEDTWFNYNVPPNIRDSYAEAQLMDHLDRVYSQERFVISDPLEVGRYIQPGERVLSKETLKTVKWKLEAGAQGYVRKAAKQSGEQPQVAFRMGEYFYWRRELEYEQPPPISVALEDLLVVGREGFFSDKKFEEKRRASLMVSAGETVEEGHMVEYTGNHLEKCSLKTPKGAEGLVVSVYKRDSEKEVKNADICWAIAPGVERGTSTSMNCSVSQLRLVRPNFLDYQKLRQESFTISDFDPPEEK